MTVEEIFSKLATHMAQGLQFHNTLMRGYDFLGLYGFSKGQEYHYLEEARGYSCLLHYYSSHYHKLLTIENTPIDTIIPENWYKYTTMDVDVGTKRNAVKTMMDKWI